MTAKARCNHEPDLSCGSVHGGKDTVTVTARCKLCGFKIQQTQRTDTKDKQAAVWTLVKG